MHSSDLLIHSLLLHLVLLKQEELTKKKVASLMKKVCRVLVIWEKKGNAGELEMGLVVVEKASELVNEAERRR